MNELNIPMLVPDQCRTVLRTVSRPALADCRAIVLGVVGGCAGVTARRAVLHWLHSCPSNSEKELNMPRDRYIPPSDDQIRKWAEEKEAKEKFHGQRSELIEAALRKLKKDELIELLMRLDTFDPAVRWSIEADVGLKKPPELIAHDLRQAIEIATRVDEKQLDTNFFYSWLATKSNAATKVKWSRK